MDTDAGKILVGVIAGILFLNFLVYRLCLRDERLEGKYSDVLIQCMKAGAPPHECKGIFR